MQTTDDTPARLVAAAERLFAEGGEPATSLRAITRAAMSNAAAVHYHFGGRDQLLCAVLEQHLAPLRARRRSLLDSQKSSGSVATVLEAALRPEVELLAKLRKQRVRLARFLGTAQISSDGALGALMRRLGEEFAADLVPPLRAVLPDVDEAELRRRLWAVRAAVAALYANAPSPDEPGPLAGLGTEGQLRWLVGFLTHAVGAPVDTAEAAPRKRKKR